METFLSEVAKRLMADHPNDLSNTTVIFNNRRSGLFLRKQLASLLDNSFFLPQIIGMDDFVSELGDQVIVPNELLLFELFDIHKRITTSPDLIEPRLNRFESFEEFISFGDIMISDFSEIDLYMVDAQQLFGNLRDLKAIGEWDIETDGKLSLFQRQYLQFYTSLFSYYTFLREKLSSQGRAYSGMAYRNVAEGIEQALKNLQGNDIYFVGFNSISKSEDIIIQSCIRNGFGHLITDGDSHYFSISGKDTDPSQEAGHFLRKHSADYPSIGNFKNHFENHHKDITIISCPENGLQAKYAGDLLKELSLGQPSTDSTALVLGDETLLIPTLNALPDQIRTANITMGFPYCGTSVHSLVLKLLNLEQHKKGGKYHHHDLLEFLSDNLICGLLEQENIRPKVLRTLTQNNIIYATFPIIQELCEKGGLNINRISQYFNTSDTLSPDEFLHTCHDLVQAIYDNGILSTNARELEALGCLHQLIAHLSGIQEQYHYIENLSVLSRIYTRLAQRRTVAFYGEPLQGIQILGVLETRNLDFKRVILLSANEGSIPSGRTDTTLIPNELKHQFHLPTYKDKDAVYAYNFYRLLQRAEEIYLIYHTESDGMGKGEPSRYISQVRTELSRQYPHSITLKEVSVSILNKQAPNSVSTEITKSEAVLDRLNHIASSLGFSPSALSKYRNCPMRFYYENVLSLKEDDTLDEELGQNELGTAIHEVLHDIYQPFIGNPIDPGILKDSTTGIKDFIDRTLSQQFNHGRGADGRNHILTYIAQTQLNRFLQKELQLLNKHTVNIISLEEPLSSPLSYTINDTNEIAYIQGTADRIDCIDNIIRVIDYKTGRVQAKELSVDSFTSNPMDLPDKWFQVMVYAWLYRKKHPGNYPMRAGIVPLGHLSSDIMMIQWKKCYDIDSEWLSRFEGILKTLIEELMNPDIPFAANANSKSCAYCAFHDICCRK